MHFRLFMQPIIAAVLAIKPGIADAKAGRTPFFWSLLTEHKKLDKNVRDVWKSVYRVFILGVILDLVYQWTALHQFRPATALAVAGVLTILPYLLARGAINRVILIMGKGRKAG